MDFETFILPPPEMQEENDFVEAPTIGNCRGYPIPGPSSLAVLNQTSPLWAPLVLRESINFCRPWSDGSVYVYYDLSSPMFSSSDRGPPYAGYALPAESAVSIGLVTSTALKRFLDGSDQPSDAARVVPLTEGIIRAERQNKAEHDRRMRAMKQRDDERVGLDRLGEDLASGFGNLTGLLINGVGKVFGTGAAAFLSGLGPIGAGVIFAGGAYGVYRLTR